MTLTSVAVDRGRVGSSSTTFLSGIPLASIQKSVAHRCIDVRIEARKQVQRNRKRRDVRPRRPPGGGQAVMERSETTRMMDVGSLGMESSDDDVDVHFLQSDDSESDDDISADWLGEKVSDMEQQPQQVDVSLEEISQSFPFELDKFQTVAIQQLLMGKSVVVCAPTGAGKTAIADAAALACLTKGKRVIYTTPLKALSNQKLYEFRQRFGEGRTGLITGDNSIRPTAPVIVMTTEILRNIFYEVSLAESAISANLEDIGLVVLDEVHYLGVPGRGSVWEELIVGCPKHIQMLCMSATVANPQDLGDWITQIHGPCSTVRTSKRPVPLSWFFAFSDPKSGTKAEIHPLLNEERTGVNPVCIYQDDSGFGTGPPPDVIPAKRVPVLHELLLLMERREFLPAIVFIFSRAECDRQAERMQELGISLTTPEEQAIIRQALDDVLVDQPEAVKTSCSEALIQGIATHHAGCLPAWKLLVERLFQDGCLKVVFATGTLAAGINMPARTTVITSTSRRMEDRIVPLGHNELLQMAGRAGRRGFDTVGNCVILQNRYHGAKEAVAILRRGTEPLTSQFTTGYSFVLNLLAKFSLSEAKVFLEKSFQNYMTGIGLVLRAEEIQELKKSAEKLKAQVASQKQDSEQEASEMKDLRASQEEATSDLRQTLKEARRERAAHAKSKLEALSYPFPVLLDTTKNALGVNSFPAMALEQRVDSKKGKSQVMLYCLGYDNTFYKVTYGSVVGMMMAEVQRKAAFVDITPMALSRKLTWQTKHASTDQAVEYCVGNSHTAKIAFHIPAANRFEPISWTDQAALLINAKSARVKELKKAARMKEKTSGANAHGEQLNGVKSRLKRAEHRLKETKRLKKELEGRRQEGWYGFKSTMEILCRVGALERGSLKILPLGHVTRELFGENELWMAIVFTHPSAQMLSPSLLAALASTLAAPNICTRPKLHFQIPPPVQLEELLAELDEPRSLLYEHEVTVGNPNQQSLMGLQMDSRAAGLVESWADGCRWEEILGCTNLDEGDLALLLNRTVDVLQQISTSRHLLDPLKGSAREALHAMDRKPIRYDID